MVLVKLFVTMLTIILAASIQAGEFDVKDLRDRREANRLDAQAQAAEEAELARLIRRELESDNPIRQRTVIPLIPAANDLSLLDAVVPILTTDDQPIREALIHALGSMGAEAMDYLSAKNTQADIVDQAAVYVVSSRLLTEELSGWYDFNLDKAWERKAAYRIMVIEKEYLSSVRAALDNIVDNPDEYPDISTGYFEDLSNAAALFTDIASGTTHVDGATAAVQAIYSLRTKCLQSVDCDIELLQKLKEMEAERSPLMPAIIASAFACEIDVALYFAGEKEPIQTRLDSFDLSVTPAFDEFDSVDESAVFGKARLYLRIREYDKAIALFDTINGPDMVLSGSYHYNYACALAMAGKTEAAFDRLRRAVAVGHNNWNWILKDPELEAVRQATGFLEWLETVAPIFWVNKFTAK